MTNILAVDTTTSLCSAALHIDNKLIKKYVLAEKNHTKLILPMIDEILSESGLNLKQINYIAFTAGPGSFTGIRIGFGIVQGLAFGADIPVLPVSSLETLAYTAIRKLKIKDNLSIIPTIDARMNEIYWAKFTLKSGVLERVEPDRVSALEELRAAIEIPGIVVGNGVEHHDQTLIDVLDSGCTPMFPEAEDIFNIAQLQIDKGYEIDVINARPVYVRNTLTWKKRKKLRST
ncbi:MAG: tRNA (adenosine(37)-N6)-threonylcarbamoyltransferase complex dimerization subunit type 1 TsaB [Porticoccus sp.]|jgi:tRNA threonylcarbamoyladenosine biosynthesis protein TsaB|nr:tRNA (adenosine(37)-N6)-threonylcarbamoyltransferase complex dimerization subunit type 1 TsaB [Porticoccus sp.]